MVCTILSEIIEGYNETKNGQDNDDADNSLDASSDGEKHGDALDSSIGDSESNSESSRSGSEQQDTTHENIWRTNLEEYHKGAVKGQHAQARRVNVARGVGFKEELDVGDICLIRMEGNERASTDKLMIPVMVCAVKPYTSPKSKIVHFNYQVCTKHGVIDKLQGRSRLEYQEHLTAELMGIDVKAEGSLKKMSVIDASACFNVLDGTTKCRCVSVDCSTCVACKCNKFKRPCSSRGHGGRGNNPHVVYAFLIKLCLLNY